MTYWFPTVITVNCIFAVMEDPEIKDIALSNKISQGQVCLAWVLAKGAALVTKSQNEGRMKENLEAQKIQLPKADIDRIDRLTANKQRLYLNPYSIA